MSGSSTVANLNIGYRREGRGASSKENQDSGYNSTRKATSGIHVVKPDRRAPPWRLVVKTLVNANGMRAARQQVGSAAGEAVKRSMGRGSTHFE